MADRAEGPVQVYGRLLSYARPHTWVFGIALAGLALDALSEVGLAYLIKPLLDDGFVRREESVIRILPLVFVGVFALRGIAGFGASYSLMWIGRHVVKRLRAELFDKYLTLPASFYDQSTRGHLLARLTYNIEQVAEASAQAVTILVRDSLTVLFMFALMLSINWQLTLFMLLVGPLIGVLVAYLSKLFRRYSARIQTNMGDVTRVAEEAIAGNREVKVFNAHARERAAFERVNEGNRRLHMKLVRAQAGSVPVTQMVLALGMAGIVYVATLEALQVSVGEFGSFLSATLLLMAPLKRLTSINVNLQRGIAAGASIFEILDEANELDTGSRSLLEARGDIVFEAVGFEYSPEKGRVLDGVELQIDAGQSVALVGPSGAGKTTLVSLLARFYDPTAGRILLDGSDIRDYRLADLRAQLGLVSQDVTLFNASIAENIAYGRPGSSSREEVAAAARNANLGELLDRLPQGLDTLVGDKGVLLSGGQRQRVAIARALLKDAPVLILDEATSALDSAAERMIQDALERLVKGRTTLVIAHRLSTVERADRIVVLDHGRVIEQGRHAELLAGNGLYADLYRLQFGRSRERVAGAGGAAR